MKILSINVSLPEKIIFKNKNLTTSIFKAPTNKTIKVESEGLLGDRQADLRAHGGSNKAVYLYSYLHYKYWSNVLSKDLSKNFGLVGENLTVDDLNEKEFFIGDELKISNVVIKVTQPRIPCYKLGIKMNSKEFVQQFINYAHLGMYAKVIKKGEIVKGDSLELIYRESNSMSVYEVSRLIFDKNENIDQMKKAMKIECLSEEIKTRLSSRLVKLGHYEIL